MSSIVLSPGATGAAAFTIEAPSTATSRVITLPDATDTLVGKATTDTLTNKSIAATQLTGTVAAARMPAGSVIQVVQATYGTTFSTTSSSFVATGLSASITPNLSSNKILMMYCGTIDNNASGGNPIITFYRGSTNLAPFGSGQNQAFVLFYSNSGRVQGTGAMSFLDSPSTTSATTYAVYMNSGGGTSTLNPNSNSSSLILMEVVA